jgi:hypothetical protein
VSVIICRYLTIDNIQLSAYKSRFEVKR